LSLSATFLTSPKRPAFFIVVPATLPAGTSS
jgi:hypothetical protein